MTRRTKIDDDNALLLRAEHEISYSAKRAIERFLGLPDDGVDEAAFTECAEAHSLCEGEVEKCKAMMAEFRIWKA